MVAMGFCRSCVASLDQQDSIARHQNQVPLFLHVFQKVEQNKLQYTPSEDVCAQASLPAAVTWHDFYAKSKRTAQHFAPPGVSSQLAPDLAAQRDSIAHSTLAEGSFKRITNMYTQPLLDGCLNQRKNGGNSINTSFRDDSISGTVLAKEVLDASDCDGSFVIHEGEVANDATCKSTSWAKVADEVHGVFPAREAFHTSSDMPMLNKDAYVDAFNAVDVYSFDQCKLRDVRRDETVGASMEEGMFGDPMRALILNESSFCDSTVKNVSELVASALPFASSVVKVSTSDRESTQVSGFRKMVDTQLEFSDDGSAREALQETALEQDTWGSCATHTLLNAPLTTGHTELLENHQAQDIETAPIEEKLIEKDGQQSHWLPPRMSHLWQDLWHFQGENNVTTSCILESDHGDVIDAVLDIAKSLHKNEALQDHLHPYTGRIDHLCGNAILYKLQKERLFISAFSLFEWMRLHTPCLLTSRSLCTIFTISGDANMVDRALVLFNNLRHRKQLWFVQVFNALLSALSKHRRYDEALLVFQEMSNMNIQPDNVTFCILMNLAKRSGSGSKALWQIFCDMEEQKIFAGHEVFAVLMKAFCEEGSREEALNLLALMERRGLIPNIVIYNILIDAFGKAGLLEEAEGLVSEMKGKGIGMSIVTYNVLIDAYGNTRNYEVAEALLQEMLDKGPLPNVCSYTALIAAYGRHFLSEKAASVFLRMKKNGVSPNAVAYTALIHAYAEDGWYEKAEYAFENMRREGLIPSVETFTSLLHAYRQAGDLRKVKSVWKMMRSERCIGTRATFNVLLDACAKQGDYAEARNVMFEFNKIGIKPDRKTYNMLINAYARGGQHDRVPEILKEMKNAGFSPDCFTYTTLIFSFLRVRDFTQAFRYHEKMCRDNQLPDVFTYRKLRALLDEKYEIKSERNMKAFIGIQRAQYSLVEDTKKLKSFRPRKTR